jgi:hypothetical protein
LTGGEVVVVGSVVVVDEVLVVLEVVVSSSVLDVVLDDEVELVDEVAAVVVVCWSTSFRTRPGNSVGTRNAPGSRPSIAARMNRRQISAGRLPPVTPLSPWFRLTDDCASMVGTLPSGSGSA